MLRGMRLSGSPGRAVMGFSIALDGEYLYDTVGIALWAASIEVDCFPTARQREWFPYLDAPWPREPHVYPVPTNMGAQRE